MLVTPRPEFSCEPFEPHRDQVRRDGITRSRQLPSTRSHDTPRAAAAGPEQTRAIPSTPFQSELPNTTKLTTPHILRSTHKPYTRRSKHTTRTRHLQTTRDQRATTQLALWQPRETSASAMGPREAGAGQATGNPKATTPRQRCATPDHTNGSPTVTYLMQQPCIQIARRPVAAVRRNRDPAATTRTHRDPVATP